MVTWSYCLLGVFCTAYVRRVFCKRLREDNNVMVTWSYCLC